MDERFRIIKQIFNTFFYRLVGFFIATFRIFIIGRNFLPTEAGAYDQILRIISMGIYFFGLNIYAYMIRIVPGEKEEKKLSLYKTLLLLETLVATLFVILIIVSKLDVFFCRIVDISPYLNILRLGLIVVIIQIVAMYFGRFFTAIKKIEYANFISFFNSGFWILLLLILWGIGMKINLLIFFLSWILGSILTIIFGLKRVGLVNFFKAKIDNSIIKTSILFGAPLVFATVGYDLVSSSSSFILSHYHTSAATGLYFVAYRPLTMIYDFVTAVGVTVFIPYIIEAHNINNIEKKSYFLSIMTKYTFIAAIPLAMGILIGRVDLIKFMCKPEYWKAESIVPFVVIMPLIYIFIYPAYYTLYLENRTVVMGIVYILGGIISVGLNFLLIPKYSYYGAASATVLSLIFVFITFYLITYKSINLKWNFIKVWKILFVSLITGLFLYFLYPYFKNFSIEVVRLIILGILILMIYISGLYFFSVFEKKEIEILKQFFRNVLKKVPVNNNNI
jgi:O-antigen/teichoic acid export membrane protein